MGIFYSMHKKILIINITRIYVKKVFTQYKLPEKIISDKDPKFMAIFWNFFLAKQKVYTVTLTVYHPQTNG